MKTTMVVTLLCLLWVETPQAQTSRLLKVNYQRLVSKADLSYDEPVVRSEEGLPIGNGRMGTLVWTTPSALHFQINRVDLFCMGNNTRSFPKGHTDYSSGCGYMDINVVDYGDDVFTGKAFNQHLSVFEGLTTAKGNGLTSRVIMWNDGDVMATEIDDQRANPEAINIDLRMLRYGIEYYAGTNYGLTSRACHSDQDDESCRHFAVGNPGRPDSAHPGFLRRGLLQRLRGRHLRRWTKGQSHLLQ